MAVQTALGRYRPIRREESSRKAIKGILPENGIEEEVPELCQILLRSSACGANLPLGQTIQHPAPSSACLVAGISAKADF